MFWLILTVRVRQILRLFFLLVRYIDHVGRRKLLLIGLFWMAVGAAGLGISFQILSDNTLVPVAMIFMLILVGGLEMGMIS